MDEALTITPKRCSKPNYSEHQQTYAAPTPKDKLRTVEEFVQQLEQAVKERL